MELNLSAFREPRGVMRVMHFIFSICAFATITAYSGYVALKCPKQNDRTEFDYPFQINTVLKADTCIASIAGSFSSDAKFFVATGVLAMLYSLAISVVYALFADRYKSDARIPLMDFVLTVIFGVLWLSSSAAWANGLSGLKSVTKPDLDALCTSCTISAGNFSSLNISVIFGFLNFFLWAADLWFLYKETAWFQGVQPQTTSGV